MDQKQMSPDQVRQCREGMRLSQPKFGEWIGYKRMAVNHMEHGRRHDTQQAITISHTANMACGAAWLLIGGYTEILEAASRADTRIGDELPHLSAGAIEKWHTEAAKEELLRRGFAHAAGALLVFPLLSVLAMWSQIVEVAPKRGGKVPKLHPLISRTVPAVAILEFASEEDAVLFKTWFC